MTMTASWWPSVAGSSLAATATLKVSSSLVTVRPLSLIAANCAPRATTETLAPPLASCAATWPPIVPAPKTQIFIAAPRLRVPLGQSRLCRASWSFDGSLNPPSPRDRQTCERRSGSGKGVEHVLVRGEVAGCLLRVAQLALHRDLEHAATRFPQFDFCVGMACLDQVPCLFSTRLIASHSAVFDNDLHKQTLLDGRSILGSVIN